nr:putative membrane protein [Quercus suber]
MRNSEDTHRTTRLVAVVAATAIALSSGTNYAFSAWAPTFAHRLQLSSTQINLIGNAGNIGMYAMGIPGGFLIDRRGPRWGVVAGVIALACGYFPLRSAYVYGAREDRWGVGWLCLFGLLTGVGSCTAFSAALKVSATNWPRHRGTATAFPLSAFGLSAFFYTAVAGVVFPHDIGAYLFLLACGTTIMVFTGMFFLQIVRPEAGMKYEPVPIDERSPGSNRRDSNRYNRRGGKDGDDEEGELFFRNGSSSTESLHVSYKVGGTDSIDEASTLVATGSSTPAVTGTDADTDTGPNITGIALFTTPKFWQLFIMLALLCGVGLMTINNIGNNARALWHHFDDTASNEFIQKRQLIHVSVLSLASFFGRLASGIGSDWLVHHHASRFWTLVCSASLFTIAQLVALYLENPNHLFWLSGLTGLAYGSLFGVYPALVADAFGPAGMGINWGAMTMAPVLSANFFNLAYGAILDKHSHLETDGPSGTPELVCDEGRACYASAYYVTMVSSLVGLGWALWCIGNEKAAKLNERKAQARRDYEG